MANKGEMLGKSIKNRRVIATSEQNVPRFVHFRELQSLFAFVITKIAINSACP
jgi:hypothetical protein